MSRHRDVRSMNYKDEYDGYDDIYGHSVEDDYCVSPSAEQFLFDRSKQQNIASFITEPDIVEDNEDIEESVLDSKDQQTVLSEPETAKLVSCMESVKNVIGDSVPEFELKEKIIKSNFNTKLALDLILKESATKNVIEPHTVNKDHGEHYADVTTTKLQSSPFTIPKFSLKKRENSFEYTSANSLTDNSHSVRNLVIGNNSSTSFTLLAGLIGSHAKSVSPAIAKVPSENNANALPFGSLAALTSHYLQKSNSTIDNTKSEGKTISPSTNFVIPKLAIKREDGDRLGRRQVFKSPDFASGLTARPHLVNPSGGTLFQNGFPNSFQILESNSDGQKNSQNFDKESLSMVSNEDSVRTPSPDAWMIDLSTALKEAEFLTPNSSKKLKSAILENTSCNIPAVDFDVSDDHRAPYIRLPTTLSLSSLTNIKLPHVKKHVSSFGRTLCRSWKSTKPIIKCHREEFHTVKRFDFSTPYART